MAREFNLPLRVYYEDTDAGGVVYYANYLKFLERGRSECLNELAIDQVRLLEQGIAFAVRHVDIDYLLPARLNDRLMVRSQITRVGAAGVSFQQCVWRDNEKLIEARVEVACLQVNNFKPCRIPAPLREVIQRAC